MEILALVSKDNTVRVSVITVNSVTFVFQCTEPRTLPRTFENIGHGLESCRAGEATSGCNRGAAVEADAIGDHEQELKRTQSGAVEIGEEQLKRTQVASSS